MFAQVTAPTIYTSKQFQRIKDNFDVSFKPFKRKYITIALSFQLLVKWIEREIVSPGQPSICNFVKLHFED